MDLSEKPRVKEVFAHQLGTITQSLRSSHRRTGLAHKLRCHYTEGVKSEDKQPTKIEPSIHRMALLTLVLIWPSVHFLVPPCKALLPDSPLAAEGLSVAVIVLVVNYFAFPLCIRLLGEHLYAAKDRHLIEKPGQQESFLD